MFSYLRIALISCIMTINGLAICQQSLPSTIPGTAREKELERMIQQWKSTPSDLQLIDRIFREGDRKTIEIIEGEAKKREVDISDEALHEIRLGASSIKSAVGKERYEKKESVRELINSYAEYLKSHAEGGADEMEFWISPLFWRDPETAWTRYKNKNICLQSTEWNRFRGQITQSSLGGGTAETNITTISGAGCFCVEINGEPIGTVTRDRIGKMRFDRRGAFLIARRGVNSVDGGLIVAILSARPELIFYCIEHSDDGVFVLFLLEQAVGQKCQGLGSVIRRLMDRPKEFFNQSGLIREDLEFLLAVTSETLPNEQLAKSRPFDLIQASSKLQGKIDELRELWIIPKYNRHELEWDSIQSVIKEDGEIRLGWHMYLDKLMDVCKEVARDEKKINWDSEDKNIVYIQASGGERFYLHRDLMQRWRFSLPSEDAMRRFARSAPKGITNM
jgi:hypothetical protein